MELKLEALTVPVSDVDRAKRFYSEQIGFAVDVDTRMADGTRLVQLTPPGSGCSIHLNGPFAGMAPGFLNGLLLVVDDIEAAHAELVGRSAEISPIRHLDNGDWVDGRGGDWNSFVFFQDPDGNAWMVQERPVACPDKVPVADSV